MTQVRRDEELLRVTSYEGGLLACRRAAYQGQTTVAVVVIGEVSERLVANCKRDVATPFTAGALSSLR